jgi:predicted small lipoprotein YifL
MLLFLLTFSASGCGNKGDLYLPDDSAETAEEADESEQDR